MFVKFGKVFRVVRVVIVDRVIKVARVAMLFRVVRLVIIAKITKVVRVAWIDKIAKVVIVIKVVGQGSINGFQKGLAVVDVLLTKRHFITLPSLSYLGG